MSHDPGHPSAEALASPDYWRSVCPELTVSERGYPYRDGVDTRPLEPLLDQIHEGGFFHGDGFELVQEPMVSALREAIYELEEQGLGAPYVFVFDEAWRLFARLAPLVDRILGANHAVLPNLWAWHVRPGPNNAGWRRHRDNAVATGPDGELGRFTLWVPLTDTDITNGCIVVEPLPDAQGCDPIPMLTLRYGGLPLAAKAGTVLGWRQDLWHRGARSTERAQGPRISLSIEFENDRVPSSPRRLKSRWIPPFAQRLQLIGDAFLRYFKFLDVGPNGEYAVEAIKVAGQLAQDPP